MRTVGVGLVVAVMSSCASRQSRAPAPDYAESQTTEQRRAQLAEEVAAQERRTAEAEARLRKAKVAATVSEAEIAQIEERRAIASEEQARAARRDAEWEAEERARDARSAAARARLKTELENRRGVPTKEASVRVISAQVETLVTISVEYPETEETIYVLDGQRMLKGQPVKLKTSGRVGSRMVLHGSVTSMGHDFELEPIELKFVEKGTLNIELDFDLALGNHRMRAEWRP